MEIPKANPISDTPSHQAAASEQKVTGTALFQIETPPEALRHSKNFLETEVSPNLHSLLPATLLSQNLLARRELLVQSLPGALPDTTTQTHLQRASFSTINTELFKIAVQVLIRNGSPFEFSDFLNTSLETGVSFCDNLNAPEISTMHSLYTNSLRKSPVAVQQELLQAFNRHLQSPDSWFSLFRRGEDLCGFLCFSQLPQINPNLDKRFIFVSALNMDPLYQRTSIGMEILRRGLSHERKKTLFFADCVPQRSASAHYIDDLGFLGYRSWSDSGEPVLDILHSDYHNADLLTKKTFPRKNPRSL